MLRKKNGFTLAELLISMTIVGVVAALAIPQVVTNVQKRQAGAVLARTVEQFELGCQNLIQAYNDKVTNGSYASTLGGVNSVSIRMLASYSGLKYVEDSIAVSDIKTLSYLPASIFVPSAIAMVNPIQPDFPINNNNNSNQELERICDSIAGLSTTAACSNNGKLPVSKLPGLGEDDAIKIDWGNTSGGGQIVDGGNDTTPDNPTQDEPTPEEPTPEEPTPEEPVADLTAINTYKVQGTKADILLPGYANLALLTIAKQSATNPSEQLFTLFIDTNGINTRPNMYGKDVFEFVLTNGGKLIPYGMDSYKTDCSDSNITDGRACTARVVVDGFKIKY